MYKVFIIDDEVWIRKGLKAMIEWERLGLQLAGESGDGQKAYQTIIDLCPDILLCDVRIPSMDGLSLSEEVLKRFPYTRIIIISGYEEFEYVKRAINFDAVSYILKPLEEDEVNIMLEKAVMQLNEMRWYNELKKETAEIMEKMILDLLTYNGERQAGRINSWLKQWEIDGCEYRVAVLKLIKCKVSFEITKAFLKKTIDDVDRESFISVLFCRDPDKIGLLVIKNNKDKEIGSYLKRVYMALKNRGICDICMGVGSAFDKISGLTISYRQAEAAIDSRPLDEWNGIVYYEIIPGQQGSVKLKFPFDLQKKLIECVQANNEDDIDTVINHIKEYFYKNQSFDIKTARYFFSGMVTEILRLIMEEEYIGKEAVEEGYIFHKMVQDSATMEEMVEGVRGLSRKIAESIHNRPFCDMDEIVRKSVQYIHNHYNENISLKMISEIHHINHCYFSTMFKDKTSVSFSDYITNVRIEKAKELLVNSDVKVSCISKQVGYDDSAYFSKLFKKHTGRIPTEYRNEVRA